MQNSVPNVSPGHVQEDKIRVDARWCPQEGYPWWRGLRVVLGALGTVAALKHDGAVAVVARALIAVGDVIVNAGEHKRS
ncbi:hypothetical protein [Actinocrispum wychmicini]|uniref:Uncharacterized protein n=1 Tax=Actinocrispum wychmicini TaxID=1213861 RepID=A0A4R2JGY9_9PSEU|nr:hypothetical protein [Actinocrispum wychmicini]TCO55639.1 hypothetical protein EV192_10761 [Actinocrispum wychmicini]